jgi:tetratricopeptide (TPR) repeat protein
MARKQKSQQGEPFYEQLRLALNHFSEPAWLGENSPLAAPYFLGEALRRVPTTSTAVLRGQVLQKELQAAAASLWREQLPHDKDTLVTAVNEERREIGNKGKHYYYLLLELRYFRLFFKNSYPAVSQEADIRDYLGVSRGPYFNHMKAARQALGDALLKRLRPTFRLERPFTLSRTLIGRHGLIQQCTTALAENQTIAISGMSGVGKTSLAAAIATSASAHDFFWFTLRPTLNDQLNSLLFSLGYFLHQRGASSLWLQLVADQGSMEDPNLSLALLRDDLARLDGKRPLLCFDEVDNLTDDNPDKIADAQLQIREFLAGLRGLCPILLIGQRIVLKADKHISLSGLNLAETISLLDEANIPFTAEEAEKLHTYTGGNPRLLNLCITLYDHGKPLTDITAELSEAPAFQALFSYLWQRLTKDERALLQYLSVFRSPVPEDAWSEHRSQLNSLRRRHIVQRDGSGGVILLPSLRDFIYGDRRWLSADLRENCHLWAAQVRATRGEYTSAAYHYVQAGEHEKAVQVWFPHRQEEIERGQTATALALFNRIPLRRLPKAEQEAAALMRAELHELVGDAEKGLADLDTVEWLSESELTAETILLQSNFLNALGYPETAVERSEDGIDTIIRLLSKLVRYRFQRGVAFIQQRQITQGWDEAQLAQFEADHLKAMIQEEQGNYRDANLSYQRALTLAQSIQYELGIARMNQRLSALMARLGQVEEAQKYAETAMIYFEQKGDRLNLEKLRCNLSAAYIQTSNFEKAVEIATPAYTFFESAKLPYWTAVTAANLAEASFEAGDSANAIFYAERVLAIDERHTHPYAWYTLGLIRHQQGDIQVAEESFRTCQQLASENEDRFIEAYAWRMLGQLWHNCDQSERAERALQRARQQFTSLGLDAEAEATSVQA